MKCGFCGKENEDSARFCSHCGKPLSRTDVKLYTQTFDRGDMKEDVFIDKINQWFADYPQAGVVSGEFEIGSRLGWTVNGLRLNALTIQFERRGEDNPEQYAVIRLQNYGLVRRPGEVLLNEWLSHNPEVTVISCTGATNQRWQGSYANLSVDSSGLGATNLTEVYVLFKFPRQG